MGRVSSLIRPRVSPLITPLISTVGSPAPSDAAITVNDLPRDAMVMDARIGRVGGGQARVALSGTATIGEVVQAYDRGAGVWRDVATADGSGDWSGVLHSTNDDGDFQVAKTRLKAATSTIADTSNTFAPGTVFMPFGQSELNYMTSAFGGDNVPGTITVADVSALQTIMIDNDEIASPSVVHSFITSETSLTKTIAVMSNTLAAYAPGRKFLYVDGHHEGTGRVQLQDDSKNDVITGRRWSVLQHVIDWVRDNGSDIGQIVEMWYVSDLSKQPFIEAWAPFYFGQTPAGDTHPMGAPYTGGTMVDAQIDHCLFDMDATPSQRGRGAFARADTRLVQMPPLPNIPRIDNLETSVTLVGGDAADEQVKVKSLRQGYVDFHADSRTIEVAGDLMPFPMISKGYWDGSKWTNGTHPSHTIPEGSHLLAKHFARAVMIASGDVTFTPPVFTVSDTDADGLYVDLELAGTGTLKTLRSIDGGVTPVGETYYTDIAGFEIIQGSTTKIDGFAATVQDAANRIVRITPDTAFSNSDIIRFGYGGGAGWYKRDSDGPAQWFKEWPLVDTGSVGQPYLFAEPWPASPEFVLSGIAGAPVADTFATADAGPWFTDVVNIASGTSAMTMFAKIKHGYTPGSGDFLIDAASTTWRVETLSTGKIRVSVEDSTGTKMLQAAVTPSAVIPSSGDFEIGLAVDLVGQWCKIFIDGVEVHEFTLLAGTGVFTTIRKVSLLAGAAGGGSQIKAEFEYVKFWYSTTVDGSEPAGAPDFEVSDAATANAHAWKLGADAT
ncbi:hypothetical protein [Profundibacter sp.]